jgi:hypothetical protein
MGLFIFYIYTQHKKNLAKKELEKLYHDKNEVRGREVLNYQIRLRKLLLSTKPNYPSGLKTVIPLWRLLL